MSETKSYRQLAITRMFMEGIGMTNSEFNRCMKTYNNFEMPLNERCKLISEGDEKFFEFAREWIEEKTTESN